MLSLDASACLHDHVNGARRAGCDTGATAGAGSLTQDGRGDGVCGARKSNRLRCAVFTAHQAQHAAAGETGFRVNESVQRPRRSAGPLREGASRTGLNAGSAEAALAILEIDLRIVARTAFEDASFADSQAVAALVAACEKVLLGLEPRRTYCRAEISDISTQELPSADALIHEPLRFSF